MPMVRLTGTVESRSDKPWSKPDGRSGVIPEATIRYLEYMRLRVSLGRDIADAVVEGQDVDLLVDVVQSGAYLNFRAEAFYPALTASKH